MADFEVIPQRSLDHLIANPSVAPQFDQAFGKGLAAEVLAAQDPQPEPVKTSAEDEGWSVMGEATRAIVGGARDAVNETANFAQWVDTAISDKVFGEGKALTLNGIIDRKDAEFAFGDGGTFETPEVAPNKTMVGGFARGVTQFVTGYATFSKLTKLQGLKAAFLTGAITDAVVFNPEDPNITKMLEEFGVETGAFGELMATDPEDPEWANRLRNAGEGILIGGIMEGIAWGLRARKAKAAGDVKGARKATAKQLEALKALDDAIVENADSVRADALETVKTEKTMFKDMTMEGRFERMRSGGDIEDGDAAQGVKPVDDLETYVAAETLDDALNAKAMNGEGEIKMVSIKSLRSIQGYVNTDGVVGAGARNEGRPIAVVEVDGVPVILDGNHRVEEALRAGKTEIEASVVKTSKPKAPKVDADGQIQMDLGDTPTVRPEVTGDIPPVKNRIYLTPEKVENIRLQGALANGVDATGKVRGLSFRSLTTTDSYDDVLDQMSGVSAVLADEFAKIKGGDVQRWASVRAQAAAQLRQMAKMTGEAPEALIARFQSANGGDMPKLAAEIHAKSRYVLTIEQELKDMAKIISDAASGVEFSLSKFPGIKDIDELRLAFNQRREVAANLLAGLDGSRANVARAMNAMKMVKKGDESLRKMLRDPAAFKDIDAAAKALVDPANADKGTMATISSSMKLAGQIGERINTFRINALLSGPGTQEVNLVSNLIQALVIPTGQAVGGAVSGNPKMVKHAIRQLQGTVAGMMDLQRTWKAVGKAGWENNAVLDPFNGKVEEDFGKIFGWKPLDETLKMPSRFLMTMDEVFKQSQYRGRIFADANFEAVEQGLKGDAKADYIKNYIKESYTDTGQAVRGEALLQARRATFTEPLDPGLASMIQKAAIDYPLVRFFVPFVRTPVNILSQTYQHFPIVGLTSRRLKADFAAGGPRRAQAFGKQAMGTVLVASAGLLAASGTITGSGPRDPRIRKVWLKNNQPYSFRIQNEDGTVEWVSYARLEPLSNVFSIAADAVELMQDKYNEAEAVPLIQALTIAVMENTVNKTFTQGISDAMTMFTGRPQEQAIAARNFVASFVPNVMNQTNGDDVMREVRSVADAIMARSWMYNQLDPKRNVLGEPVVRTLPKYDPLGLTEKDVRKIDPVMEEITKFAILNQAVADSPSRKLDGPNQIDLSEIPYSPTQSVFDRWLELTGTVKINGRDLRQELEKLIESRAYKLAPKGDIGVDEKTKGALIRKVIEAYRKKAKGTFPQLREITKAEKQGTGILIKNQVKRNRELFPPRDVKTTPRRSFEELLK